MCDNHQYGWRNSGLQIYDNMVITDCLHAENSNCLSHAVCDDSVTLMPLIQFIRALFSDGGDTAGRSGHDSDEDGSPAGLLGYLPRCLCSVSSPRENKGGLTLVQLNGLFNKTITPITRSTKRREGINPSENALKPQLIRLQLHTI